MRCVATVVLIVLLATLSFAQDSAPPMPTGSKAGPSPEAPSFDIFNWGAPELSGVDPDRGPVAGGTAVILNGKKFTIPSDMTVMFGDQAATSITVVNPRTLTCLTPAHGAGVVDITVTTRFGTDTLTDAFTYFDPPALSGISPEHGTTAGGTGVTLSGSHFTTSPDTSVTFDGDAATNVVVVDANTVTCDTPAHAAGTVDVTLTNSNGSDTLAGAFTYHEAPQVVSIDPDSGPDSGGTGVTIYGTKFTSVGATTVTFDGLAAASVVVVDTATITCVTPAHAAGAVDVVVGNDFGSDTLAGGFTYTSSSPVIHVPGDYPTIQQAVNAAVNGDTILVAPGTYDEILAIPGKEILIRTDADGVPGTVDLSPETTFIDGNQFGPVVTFQGGAGTDATLRGFTIVNGYNPTFAYTAGGIYCQPDSFPTITDNIIIANACDFGTGGMKSESENASQLIADNIICGNYSHFGGSGGLMVVGEDASHIVSGNMVAGNRSEATCGGMTLSGIDCDHLLVNNFISGNAGDVGGGLSIGGWEANNLTLLNNTVINNYAAQKGGGMELGGWLVAHCANTILWNNSAPLGPEICMSTAVLGTSELQIRYSDVEGGQGLVNVEPTCTLTWGNGMLNTTPGLNTCPTGSWTSNGTFNASTYQVTFTDSSAFWTVNELAGMLVNPDTAQTLELYIVSNTATTITAWVDWDTIYAGASWVSAGNNYAVYDYHLTAGSSCIDVGDDTDPDLPAKDINGDDRVLDGDGDLTPEVDLGADEFVL